MSYLVLDTAGICFLFLMVQCAGVGMFIVRPEDTVVYHGDETQLNCIFKDKFEDKAWFYNGSRITKGADVLGSSNQYGLVIDGDVYNLQVFNATPNVSGTYACESQQNSVNRYSAKLYIIGDITHCSLSPNSTTIEGHKVVFRCAIDLAEDAPGHLVWLKQGGESYRGANKVKNIIWVRELEKSDNGAEFDCQYQHKTLPRFRWSTISCDEKIVLKVQYAPNVSIDTVGDSTILEGRSFVAHCHSIDANPKEIVEVKWKYPNGSLISQHVTLILHSLTRYDSGKYTCYMSNVFYNGEKGIGEASVDVDVQYMSNISIAVHPAPNITEGNNITFYCKAGNGNPNPDRMVLSFGEKEIIKKVGPILQHTINGVEGSDSGIYKCVAFTNFYDGSRNSSSTEQKLTIYYSPKQVSANATYTAAINDVVSMACEVHGVPKPNLTWLNTDGSLIFHNDSNKYVVEKVDRNNVISTLTVVAVDESNYGTYTCEAVNGIPPNISQKMEIVRPASDVTAKIAGAVGGVVVPPILVISIIGGIYCWKRRQDKYVLTAVDNGNTRSRETSSQGTDDRPVTLNPIGGSQEAVKIEQNNDDEDEGTSLIPEEESGTSLLNEKQEGTSATDSGEDDSGIIHVNPFKIAKEEKKHNRGKYEVGDNKEDATELESLSVEDTSSERESNYPEGEITYAALEFSETGVLSQLARPTPEEPTVYADIQIDKTKM